MLSNIIVTKSLSDIKYYTLPCTKVKMTDKHISFLKYITKF